MSVHFYDIGNFFLILLNNMWLSIFSSFSFFIYTHTLKQPHKCHYKIENTPSFLYTNVQATYGYSSLYSISKSNIIILEKT